MTAVRVIRVHREDPAIGPRATCDPDVRRVARDRLERRLAVTAALVLTFWSSIRYSPPRAPPSGRARSAQPAPSCAPLRSSLCLCPYVCVMPLTLSVRAGPHRYRAECVESREAKAKRGEIGGMS